MQLGFSFDISRCSGCMACVVACMDQHDLPGDGASLRHVTPLERGRFPSVHISFLSLACLHCGDAPCIMACPTGAIFKREEDGIVDVFKDICVGCHNCALACPFGAPQFTDSGKMAKCDFCIERIEAGLEPACVRACPTLALGFGPIDRLSREKAGRASRAILTAFYLNPGAGK
ncbi:MAG: 4Fe-4S dicluster domain-containing protein [Desulfatiglandales bacterium]